MQQQEAQRNTFCRIHGKTLTVGLSQEAQVLSSPLVRGRLSLLASLVDCLKPLELGGLTAC